MTTNLIDSVGTKTWPITAGADYEAPAQVIVRDLIKRYGDLMAVAGVSFDVRRGEVFGLLGPNGAGKTTTVEIIEGLRSRDSGEVTVCGFDPAENVNDVKKRIGVALQATALPDKIEVREALTLFGGFYPMRRGGRADVDWLLRTVSLEEKAKSRFDTLSGGQQQRLAVALALVNDPEVVILDEPTTGLDAQARRELHDVIGRLKRESKTVILTTHYIEEAERLCDRVAIIDRGRVIAEGTPRELISGARGQSRIELRTARPVELAQLRSIPFVESVTESGGAYVLRSSDAPRALIELVKWMEAERHELLDFITSDIASNLLVSLSTLLMQIALAKIVYKIEIAGSVFATLVMLVVGALAFFSLGFVVASVADNVRSAQVLCNLIFFPLMFLGGAAFPLQILPPKLQDLARVLPSSYMVDGLYRVMKEGEGLVANLKNLGVLLLSCAVSLVIAAKLFRWEASEKMPLKRKAWAATIIVIFIGAALFVKR